MLKIFYEPETILGTSFIYLNKKKTLALKWVKEKIVYRDSIWSSITLSQIVINSEEIIRKIGKAKARYIHFTQ